MKIFEQRIVTIEEQMGVALQNPNRSLNKGHENINVVDNEFIQKNYNELQNIKKEMNSQSNFLQSQVNMKQTDFKMTQGSQQNATGDQAGNKYDTMKQSVQNNVFNQNLYNMEQNNQEEGLHESFDINERISDRELKRSFVPNQGGGENIEHVEGEGSGEYEMDEAQA